MLIFTLLCNFLGWNHLATCCGCASLAEHFYQPTVLCPYMVMLYWTLSWVK